MLRCQKLFYLYINRAYITFNTCTRLSLHTILLTKFYLMVKLPLPRYDAKNLFNQEIMIHLQHLYPSFKLGRSCKNTFRNRSVDTA